MPFDLDIGSNFDSDGADPDTLEQIYGTGYERAVVQLYLTDEDFRRSVGIRLTPSLFNNAACKMTVTRIRDHVSRYRDAPSPNELAMAVRAHWAASKQGTAARTDLTRAMLMVKALRSPSAKQHNGYDPNFIRDHLKQFMQHRAMQSALLEASDMWATGEYEKILESIQDAVAVGDTKGADLGLNFSDAMAKIRHYRKRKASLLHCPLGIDTLDDLMRGGLEPGTLGIFIAPAGRGKTMLQVHAGAVALRQGIDVAHITLEISQTEVMARYDAHITSIPINALVTKTGKHLSKILSKTRALTAKLRIKEWGSSECSTDDLRAWLRLLKARTGVAPGLLLIDYADLLRPSRNQDRRFELADIIRQLRQIARDFNCAVWTASQTGRASFTAKFLSLSDVFECLEKIQVADVVIGLCQTHGEKTQGKMRLALLKNRLGGHEGHIVDCLVTTETSSLQQNPTQAPSLQMVNP